MSESDQVAELRHLNALVYARPSSGSLIAERTQKLSYPASLTYTLGSTMQFIVNVNESVWGPSSYLRLKLTMTTAANAATTLGGSWFNLFSQVRLYSRGGELLEQVFFSDILSAIKLRYNTSFSDYQKLYSLIGGAATVGGVSTIQGAQAANTFSRYVNLPLSLLFGLFDNHSQFIPSQLLAGARMELVLNSTNASMVLVNVVEGSLQVVPTLSLDCAKIYDEAAKQIMEESADVQESGIQFTYSTFFASQFQPAGGAINIDVLQSASLTEKVMVVNTTTTAADKYTFRPLALPAANGDSSYAYQFRIGAHYLPIYSVQDDTEAFYQTQIAFNGAYNQFSRPPTHTGIGVASFGLNNCVYATSLEKSASNVALSGEPTNNSRLINFSAQGTTGDASVATVFLQYVRVANCMLDSCVVDR